MAAMTILLTKFTFGFLEGEKQEFPAHRVIVAARCDWFRRALLSGMKESIQKYAYQISKAECKDCSR